MKLNNVFLTVHYKPRIKYALELVKIKRFVPTYNQSTRCFRINDSITVKCTHSAVVQMWIVDLFTINIANLDRILTYIRKLLNTISGKHHFKTFAYHITNIQCSGCIISTTSLFKKIFESELFKNYTKTVSYDHYHTKEADLWKETFKDCTFLKIKIQDSAITFSRKCCYTVVTPRIRALENIYQTICAFEEETAK